MEYTDKEIEDIVALCRELLEANETMRANVIAMSAKLENEEKKTRDLSIKLHMLSLAFTNNTYQA